MATYTPTLLDVQLAILVWTYETHRGEQWPADITSLAKFAGDNDRLTREAVEDMLDREALTLRKYSRHGEYRDYGRGTRITDSIACGGFYVVPSFRTRREYDAASEILKSHTRRRIGMRQGSFLDDFPRSDVTLLKKDGRRFETNRACVTTEIILLEDVTLPVEAGHEIQRKLPNGLTETFVVTDPGFMKGAPDLIPDHFQVKYRKGAVPVPPGFTINQHGPGSRVLVNSPDSSVNVTVVGNAVFNDVRSLVRQVKGPTARAELFAVVDTMERECGTATFKDRYKEFISLAADHMTLLGPAITALSGFL